MSDIDAKTKARGRPPRTEGDRAVALRIRERREQLGISKREVAAAIGVNEDRYRYWETSFGKRLQEEYGRELAAALETTPDWLLEGRGDPPVAPGGPADVRQRRFVSFEGGLGRDARIALATRAKARRQALRMMVPEFAVLASLAQHIVRSWERELPRHPNEHFAERWEKTLAVPPGWLTNETISTPALPGRATASLPLSATVAQHIREVGRWLVATRMQQRDVASIPIELDGARARRADIFARRYGVAGEDQATLQMVGDHWKITRERVRQIVDKLLARGQRQLFPAGPVEQLKERVSALLPATIEALDAQLHDILGEQLSIADADRFAREILGFPVLAMSAGMGPTAVAPLVAMGIDPKVHDIELVRGARDVALRMISNQGAANLYIAAGMLAEETGRPVMMTEVRKALAVVQGFEWLSERDGWFWFGVDPRNRIVNLVMKILAVARRRLDIEEIHAGITRSRRVRLEIKMTFDLPLQVLGALVARCPGVRTVQRNDFELETAARVEEALSGTELEVHRFLAAHGGVADRKRIARELVGRRGVAVVTLQVALDQAPTLVRLDYGLYAIRGWRLDGKAIARAVAAATRNRFGGAKVATRPRPDGALVLRKRITDYILRNHAFGNLPETVATACPEGHYQIEGSAMQVELRRAGSGGVRCRGMMTVLRALDIKAGDTIEVAFKPRLRTVAVTSLRGA